MNVLIGLLHRPKTIDVPALVWLRRMNLDLQNSADDGSQRMLNAIEPGLPLPIHRHRKSSETVVCLRGHLREVFLMIVWPSISRLVNGTR